MRRAALVLALVIGLMGVMVLPVQAHRGSDDSRGDSRNESNGDNRSNNDDRDHRDLRFGQVVRLSGDNEVPVGDPDGSGWAKVKVRPDNGTVCYTIKVKNLDAVTAAHIHLGAVGVNGDVVVDFGILTADSKVRGNSTFYWDCIEGLDVNLLASIKENRAGYYVNVHTTVFPNGAIRGQLGKVKSS